LDDAPVPLIELRDVAKIYDLGAVQVAALRGATFNIGQGEYVALMGASGSGKSTLMNTLGCLDRPTSGSYQLAGELPLLYAKHIPAWKRHQRAKELLERVGLADRLDHHTSQLSGGQQQRVAIARALVNEPDILMADEPTGNLDTRTSREVIELFGKLNEESGLTIILVTHDQAVARHSKRQIVLRDGEIVCDTTDFAAAIAELHAVDDQL
jgi:putative ABC transport system ATP-binding protein